MSRRCKAGQRARVIAKGNHGSIVLIVRCYFGETVEGGKWPQPIHPWVVASLGGLLSARCLETGAPIGPYRTIVLDDSDLEPLDHDDDGLQNKADCDRPKSREQGVPSLSGRLVVSTHG